MDHNLSSLKAGLPPSSSTYSPHQDDTLSPDFILQQLVNGDHKRRMPSIIHSTMVTSTPNNDTTTPSHNTQGGGEPTSSAYQQQSGSTHGNGGQLNPCDAIRGCEGGSSAGAGGGSGGDGHRGQDRPPDQDDEDDTSHEQSAETTSSSGSSSVPHAVPPIAAVQNFPSNPNAVVVRHHNGSSQHQDRQTSHEESITSDNDSVGGVSDATTAVVSDSDRRWQGILPSSIPNHRSSSSAVTKSSSSSLNSSDTRTATVSEALDASSIVTISTLSSFTNTSSSSTDGKNILLSSVSKHKGNITHDSSEGSLTLETRHVAHHSPPPSPPMSQSFQESDNFDLDDTGAPEEALSSTPVESCAPLQLSEPMLVLETLDEDDDGDVIPSSLEAYGSNASRIIPSTPPEEISAPEDNTVCRQKDEDSPSKESSLTIEKAKENLQLTVAAKEISIEETDQNVILKTTQTDPPSEKIGVNIPTKLSDEQLSRGVEISPVKISPLQDLVNRCAVLPSAAVSRRIQFDSSTDESQKNTPNVEKTIVQLPPTKSCDKQHSSLTPPVPSSTRLPTQIIRKLLDWPQEDLNKESSATSSSGSINCDTSKASERVETINVISDTDPDQSDRVQSSEDQASPQNTSQKHNTEVIEISTAFTSTPSDATRKECTFISPSLPVNSQQLHLEDDSSTDEYDDEEDDPKNTFTQVESQGGNLEPLVLSDLDESISPDAVLVSAFHDIPMRPLVNVTRDKKEVYKKLVPVPSKKVCSAETQLAMQNMQLHPPISVESTKPISGTAKTTDIPLAQQLIPEEDPFAMLRQPDLSFGEMMLGLPGPSGVKRDPPPQPHHSDTDSDASESNLPQEPPKLSIRELLKSHELHSMIPMCSSVKGKGRGKRSKMTAMASTISLEESLRQEFTSVPQLLPPAYDPMQRPSPKPPDKVLHSELMSNQVFVSTDNELNIAIATELSLQEQHSLRTAPQVNRASVFPSDNYSIRSNENTSGYSVNNSAATVTTTSTTTTTTAATSMSSTTTTTSAGGVKGQAKSEVRMRYSSVAKQKARSRLPHQTTLRARIVKGRLKQISTKEEQTVPETAVASSCLEGRKAAVRGGCRNAKKRSASCVQREMTAARLPSASVCVAAVAKRHAISKALQKVARPRRFLSSKGQDKRKVIFPEDDNAEAVATEVHLSSEDSEVPNAKCTGKSMQDNASILRCEGDMGKILPLRSKHLQMEEKERTTKEMKSAPISADLFTHPVTQRVITTTIITKRVIVEEFFHQGKVVGKHCHQIEDDPVTTRLVEEVPPGCSPCTIKDAACKTPLFRTPSNASTSSSSLTKASSSGSLADISSMGSSSSNTSYPSHRVRNKSVLKQPESPEARLSKVSSMEIDLEKRLEEARPILPCSADCTNSGSNSQTLSVQNESPQQVLTNLSEASSSLNLEATPTQYSLRCKGQAKKTESLRRKRVERKQSGKEEINPTLPSVTPVSSTPPPCIRQLNENTPRSGRQGRLKQTPDNSERKRKRSADKSTNDEEMSASPVVATSSQSEIPDDEDSSSIAKVISEGLRVMARWQDGRYYPGTVISKDSKDRWVVKFDDGDARPILETRIFGIQRLPAGTSVYAKSESDDFDCGIVEAHFYQHSALHYVVDTDSGKKLVVPCSSIMMTSDQVSCLVDRSEPNSEEGSVITLKNVVDGNRRSRLLSNTESPVKRTPPTPKPKLSPKESTPKTPKSLRGQRRPHDAKLEANVQQSTPKRRRQETPTRTTPGRKNQKSTPTRTPKRTPSAPTVEVSKETAEKTAVQDPALGPIPPTGSTLFLGLIVVLTSAEKISKPLKTRLEEGSSLSSNDTTVTEEEDPASNPFSKSHLKLQIQTGGGIVLDEFDDTFLDSKDCFLVSNDHVRTSKFLRCLAVGIPCVSHVWIINSCCLGKRQDYKAYLLPAGLNIITKRLVEWHGKTHIFDGYEICVSGNADFVAVWSSIVKSTGAAVVSRLPVLSGGKNADVPNIYAVVADSTCPSSTIRRCSKLGIPVVSSEWVVQCLIQGKRLGLDDHPKFNFNFSSDS